MVTSMKTIKNPLSRGVTLIELMVVIAIIGLLATIVIPNVRNAMDKGKRVTALANLNQMKSALERYNIDMNSYPSSDQGLNALVSAPSTGNSSQEWQGPYLDKIPPDPWGHPYVYQSDGSSFVLKSLGADGAEGGAGRDADIDASSS